MNKDSSICIMSGNNKLGRNIPNVSLLAGKTCGEVPCKAKGLCYDAKFYFRKSVLNARKKNTNLALKSPDKYFAMVRSYLAKHSPRHWRWHVGGDFPNQAYLDECKRIAMEFPEIRFLAFTKRHDFDFSGTPDNFSIVFSLWPGWGDPSAAEKYGFRRAWMQDGTENRIPPDAFECPGGCDNCMFCWALKDLGRDVWFAKH